MWYLVVAAVSLGAGIYVGYDWGARRAVAKANELKASAAQAEDKFKKLF